MVRRLTDALAHRGPDGVGFYQKDRVSLGMRRLSIMDPEGGWQPLYSEDKQVVCMANGEIYNFVELRKELESRGHRFRSRSDCEVIVHLYEEMGDSFVDRLRGMFAIALWDERNSRLCLVRDRMGEKPLYLAEQDGQITFASEMKALLRAGVVPFELDPTAIYEYLYYNFVPEPRTAVRGVRKLPAATILTVDVKSWLVRERRYWSFDEIPPLDAEPVEAIRAQLAESGIL